MITQSATQVRAAIYARISQTDIKTPKVEDQTANLETFAGSQGYAVVARYADDGISASTGELRPDWERLLADMAAGAFDVILATEQERLVRNNLETQYLILACVQAGTSWETIRGGKTDPTTASGQFQATVFGEPSRV